MALARSGVAFAFAARFGPAGKVPSELEKSSDDSGNLLCGPRLIQALDEGFGVIDRTGPRLGTQVGHAGLADVGEQSEQYGDDQIASFHCCCLSSSEVRREDRSNNRACVTQP